MVSWGAEVVSYVTVVPTEACVVSGDSLEVATVDSSVVISALVTVPVVPPPSTVVMDTVIDESVVNEFVVVAAELDTSWPSVVLSSDVMCEEVGDVIPIVMGESVVPSVMFVLSVTEDVT